jgi:carboxypeptidase C (cathepsin A)
VAFFEEFPEFLPNDFYISGESYGGIYVPYLANNVVNYNKAPTSTKVTKINIKGMLVGNGVTNWNYDTKWPTPDYNWYHALYGQELRDEWVSKNCQDAVPNPVPGMTNPTAECQTLFDDI